jgi:hypothetical protein
MIISASYRTDIPAFYGEWFTTRLDAGFCRTVNPYGRQIHTLRLDRDAVSGFVFWTKNLGPFRAALEQVRGRGFPFVIQYTINAYPRELETSVTDAERAIGHMHDLAREFGPRVGVWRYDPVISTSMTPPHWHIGNFTRLADRLAGATDEVVISFTHIYRKTRSNMDAASQLHGFRWDDPSDDAKRELIGRLVAVAADRNMQVSLCSQEAYLVPGSAPARCIDAERLSDVAGRPVAARRKGNRPGCMCSESRDIGDYDTCPHGCVYCYAVRTPALARRRHRAHEPGDPLLSPPE